MQLSIKPALPPSLLVPLARLRERVAEGRERVLYSVRPEPVEGERNIVAGLRQAQPERCFMAVGAGCVCSPLPLVGEGALKGRERA